MDEGIEYGRIMVFIPKNTRNIFEIAVIAKNLHTAFLF